MPVTVCNSRLQNKSVYLFILSICFLFILLAQRPFFHSTPSPVPNYWPKISAEIWKRIDERFAHMSQTSPSKLSIESGGNQNTSSAQMQPKHRTTLAFNLPNAGARSPTNISYISNVPMMVWAFWFGRPMQGKRLEAWKSLQANIGVPITLVTDQTLSKYNVSSHPMHPVLNLKKGLSMNHKVDYLRVYFMHHFGGGYHDVKPHKISWEHSFGVFKDPDVWVFGINEGAGGVGCANEYVIGSPLCEDVKAANNGTTCCQLVVKSWKSLVSNGAYILRPNTSLTYEWLTNVEPHLTDKYEQIKEHPAPRPRCCLGHPGYGYPIRWTELHGEAFHPLQWKYNVHVRQGLPPWARAAYHDETEDAVYNSSDVGINGRDG